MAKKIDRLNALAIKKATSKGMYPDGRGLYLQVSSGGSKSWIYRYETNGKQRHHGLGGYPAVSLKEAREKADRCRALRRSNIDPIAYERQKVVQSRLDEAKSITFRECATAYIESHRLGWKNPKHEMYWRNTLESYAYPIIGNLAVQSVDTGLVLEVIEPIWRTKTETASRVRQRIENILDWAKVREYREGENPARWRGHLDKLLPKRQKVQKVQHFPAMPYRDIPAYFSELRQIDTVAAKVLAFTILTASRAAEARECHWDEIDMQNRVWTLPADRMKAGREHRVPISDEALIILGEVKGYDEEYLFPGIRHGKPITDTTVRNLLQKTHPNYTVHGFRSSFRDWCAEMTAYPREVAESALAHSLGNATEAAYQRGDLFAKRGKLMAAWSDYCLLGHEQAEIVPIRATNN